MALKDTTRFESCLKLATESKELWDKAKEFLKQAKSIEEKAVESFKQEREEMLKALQHEKEKLEEELNALKTEYFELLPTFCQQKNPISGCGLCYMEYIMDYHRPPEDRFYSCHWREEENEEVIKEASEQTEDFELKKIAQKILEIREQYKSIKDKLNENSKGFKEICSLFGHDAKRSSNSYSSDYYNEKFKCKCCGEEMGYIEYRDAYRDAKYKGVIVPFDYDDNSTIL